MDRAYDVAVVDAFNGQRSLRWMEQFIQGGSMPIRTKGGQKMKRHNIPTIVCSNGAIPDVYPRVGIAEWNVLEVRFLIVQVFDFIDFYLDQDY